MSKINILDKDVYNKIAAGEVVEKPASVVKELVENSIDAGATNITIEILDGGITKIKVIDNGCGIEKDDFSKVFLAHATSKVKNIEDLSSIGTLGFRGEALSSIASVSNVTMSSKIDSDIGYQMKVNGGEVEEIEPTGMTNGTCMVVENLFFNIPARKKFLRKPKQEENDITNLISRLILAHPEISFKYSADNKIVYQSFGTGLYDAIYSIYGKSIVDNIFEVNFEKGDFKFSGYLCKPTFSKPNRTYQTLIVNGRYVINQTISTAIYKAYENFIMKGNFPFFVLNLNIPLDKVDVNVHPNKLDIKFEDSNQIFGIVYSEVTDILYRVNNTKIISTEDETVSVNKSKLVNLDNSTGSEYHPSNSNISNLTNLINSTNFSNNNQDTNATSSLENLANQNQPSFNKDTFTSSNNNSEENEFEIKEVSLEDNSNAYASNPSFNFNFKLSSSTTTNNFINNENEVYGNTQESIKIEQDKINLPILNYKLIGTYLDTYILIQKDNNLLFIDQHAGHERILFDKFSKELEDRVVAKQNLLVPFIIETNTMETQFIYDNLSMLSDLGFELSNFGDNCFKVESVPMLLENINIEEFFDNILSDIDNKLILNKKDTLKDYLAKRACKSAVKGKDVLSSNEIEYLLNAINNPTQVLLCPHGRPIIISLSEKEIEKWFKRIV